MGNEIIYERRDQTLNEIPTRHDERDTFHRSVMNHKSRTKTLSAYQKTTSTNIIKLYDNLYMYAREFTIKAFTEEDRVKARDSIKIIDVHQRGIVLEYFDQLIEDYTLRYDDDYHFYLMEQQLLITHNCFKFCKRENFAILVDSLKLLQTISYKLLQTLS